MKFGNLESRTECGTYLCQENASNDHSKKASRCYIKRGKSSRGVNTCQQLVLLSWSSLLWIVCLQIFSLLLLLLFSVVVKTFHIEPVKTL